MTLPHRGNILSTILAAATPWILIPGLKLGNGLEVTGVGHHDGAGLLQLVEGGHLGLLLVWLGHGDRSATPSSAVAFREEEEE